MCAPQIKHRKLVILLAFVAGASCAFVAGAVWLPPMVLIMRNIWERHPPKGNCLDCKYAKYVCRAVCRNHTALELG